MNTTASASSSATQAAATIGLRLTSAGGINRNVASGGWRMPMVNDMPVVSGSPPPASAFAAEPRSVAWSSAKRVRSICHRRIAAARVSIASGGAQRLLAATITEEWCKSVGARLSSHAS